MKKYLLSIYLLAIVFPQSYGQMGTRPSVTLHFGPAFLFGEPSHSFKESFAIVNMGVDCAAVVIKDLDLQLVCAAAITFRRKSPKTTNPGKAFWEKRATNFTTVFSPPRRYLPTVGIRPTIAFY